jgi:hypothetical protein
MNLLSTYISGNKFEDIHIVSRKLKKLRQHKRKRQQLIWAISAGLLLVISAVYIFVDNARRINPELIEVQGQPAIRVDQELIDYGYKTWNTNLTFDIKVTNVGNQTLRFSETPYVEVLEGC